MGIDRQIAEKAEKINKIIEKFLPKEEGLAKTVVDAMKKYDDEKK